MEFEKICIVFHLNFIHTWSFITFINFEKVKLHEILFLEKVLKNELK